MTNRMIQAATNNQDKRRTYAKQLGRYKQAMKYGFYLEAIMIDYAMIEDRLRSMLYHMGFVANRTATGVYKKTKNYLSEMVTEYKTEKEKSHLGITNISGKMKLVRCVMMWAAYSDNRERGDKFLAALKSQCDGMDGRCSADRSRWHIQMVWLSQRARPRPNEQEP